MKHLFDDETLYYNDIADQIDGEITKAIQPIIDRWVDAGYNIREIGLLAMLTVNDIILEHLLTHQREFTTNGNNI